eukprot:gene12791-15007_t
MRTVPQGSAIYIEEPFVTCSHLEADRSKSTAEKQYHLASCPATSGVEIVRKYCTVEKRRFPILAARILSRILLGYHFQKNMHHWENLQVLAFAKKDAPLEWKDDYATFKRALLTKESNINRANKPTVASPTSSIGLFFLTSFVNHSCEPNCFLAYPDNNSTLHLTALKEIKKGEEITIAYGDPSKNIVERRTHLFDNYGFNCECPKCLSELPSSPKKQKN